MVLPIFSNLRGWGPATISWLVLAGSLVLGPIASAGSYDPLALQVTTSSIVTVDMIATRADGASSRTIPLRVYLPPNPKPAPVVLFSHGLGGTREGSAYLGQHWAARGYVAVFLQHPGSDDGVWKNQPVRERMAAMRNAASSANLVHRLKDVPAVLDSLTVWNTQSGHRLHRRLDLERIGMSGHSFGAMTTQATSGMSLPWIGQRYTDRRIRAAVIMSPSLPRSGGSPDKAFANVSIPWLLMTGTKDDSPIGNMSPADRLAVFPALPAGNHYELVLDGADHGAFTEMAGRTRWSTSFNPNHHRVILALSTAFWDKHLKGQSEAGKWLDGSSARSVLESGDVWRSKGP